MSERQDAERVCRGAASGTLLALGLVLITLVSILTTAPLATAVTKATKATMATAITAKTAKTAVPAAGPTATPPATLSVTLTAITPTVAVPKAPITIRGSARNSGSVPITSPFARASLGALPLTSRQAVADWATTPDQRSLTEVARISLGKTLRPRTSAKFVLTIPANATSRPEAFAILPLRIDVVGTTRGADAQERAALTTFLPTLSAVKAFEPLSVAWLMPLTLDPDPALHGMNSPARTAAWDKAIGPGSRLDNLIAGTEKASVTWAVDPAILGPQQSPSTVDAAGPSPTSTPTKTPAPGSTAAPDPVVERTTALANRLRAAAPRHTLWSLPYADPDLAAILPLASDDSSLEPEVGPSDTLDVAVGPARGDIAWPVEGTVTPQSQAQLARVFAGAGLAGSVTSASTLTSRGVGSVGGASHKTSGGLPLLAYDDALSRTVAQASSKQAATLIIQQFLADSMALLGEWPGTRDRSVLIAEPRTFDGDPAVLRALFAAVAKAPWLTTTTTDRILEASQKMEPEVLGLDRTPQSSPGPTPSAPTGGESPTAADPLAAGTSPLTVNQLRSMPKTQSAITGIASILDDGQLYGLRWTDAQDQLVSARWRGHPEGLATVTAATSTAISTVSRAVTVAPSSVNFFADQGVLPVTVVNALGVAIHDVHLKLTPAQPRLRIAQQPGPLRIGAMSRANVPLQVTAIAAGMVPIEAVLTTSNGTPLGQSAQVNVRVHPTSTWIYYVLGGLAGLVLILGTYRSLRQGSTRASRPEAPKMAIDD